jgi:histidine triad (HIT) family protein
LYEKVQNFDVLFSFKKAEEKNKPILGHLLYVVSIIAKEQKLEEGFRVVINNGKHGGDYKQFFFLFIHIVGQSVDHLHIHILGGAQCSWPPGTPGPGGENMPKN